MKSIQDITEIYRQIAKNLNLQGDSVEVIVQMLANATYISEVEHVAYSQEASLEKATLINSKIQHCVNEMYSVFRGTCPRVMINFSSTKYFRLNMFDELISSNTFKIYYLGYYNTSLKSRSSTSTTGQNFIYSPIVIPPTGLGYNYTLIGLLAKETITKDWVLPKSNTYYVDLLEDNLSNDLFLKVNDEFVDTTRVFSDHITKGQVFDLTLPSFGARFYSPDIFRKSFSRDETETPSNTKISTTVYKYCTLDSINQSELKLIKLKGAVLNDFDKDFIESGKYPNQISTGIICLPEVPRDDINTIHYKANRDRYVNSIIRSNNDIGVILEEMYPEKIRNGGTNYKFIDKESLELFIYYIPYTISNLLSSQEIEEYKSTRSSYYVTDTITVQPGKSIKAIFSINAEIYQNISIDDKIKDILKDYEYKFKIDLEKKREDIKSSLIKIPNVKSITDLSISYFQDERSIDIGEIDLESTYFNISYQVNSIIYSE